MLKMDYKGYKIYEEIIYGVITPEGKGIASSLSSVEVAKKRIDRLERKKK